MVQPNTDPFQMVDEPIVPAQPDVVQRACLPIASGGWLNRHVAPAT